MKYENIYEGTYTMTLSRNTLILVSLIAINNLLWVAITYNQVLQTKQNIRFAALSEVFDYSSNHGSVPSIDAAIFVGIISELTDAPKEPETEAYIRWLDSHNHKSSILESVIKRHKEAGL